MMGISFPFFSFSESFFEREWMGVIINFVNEKLGEKFGDTYDLFGGLISSYLK